MTEKQISTMRKLNQEAESRYSKKLISNCCGAGLVEDTTLCSLCLEHCEPVLPESEIELSTSEWIAGLSLVVLIMLGLAASFLYR
jgi:hypothetical protein